MSRDDARGERVELAGSPADFPRIEGFQIVAPLGAGGMGAVYRAVQLSTGRQVALKLLRGAAFGSPRALARFQREVELLARLEHPHIARLYHSGQTAGCGYFAMELVDGVHLDDYVRNHALSQSHVLDLMVRVCRAVDHAHRRGVIHRDLKPSNIVVDAAGEPHILDFGLAKLVEGDAGAAGALLTEDGATAGTLHFMSPEQAAGRNAAVDTRSDVYSLGVILYRLLTHRLPHPQEGSTFQVQRSIIEDEPIRPRTAGRLVARDLEAVLLKALAREPDQRYPTAGQLADDLENYLGGEPVRARKLTAGYFLGKRLRRHWASLSIAAAIVLVLVGGAVASYIEIGRQRDRAQASADAAEHALYLNRLALARAALDKHDSAQAVAVLDRSPPELRQWEWRYLRKLADSSTMSFAADDVVRQLLPDPRAKTLRIVSRAQVLAWNLQTGAPIERHGADLAAGDHPILTGDGRHRLDIDGRAIDVRDAATGELVRRFTGHHATGVTIKAVAGELVASVDDRNHLMLWSAASGQVRRQVQAPQRVTEATINQAGALAFLVEDRIRLHMLPPGDHAQAIVTLPGVGRAMAFNAAGTRLLVGGDGGYVALIEHGGIVRNWTFDADVGAVAVADAAGGGGQAIAAAGTSDGRIYRLDLDTGAMLGPVRGLGPRGVEVLTFLDAAGQTLAASAGPSVKLWRFPEALPVMRIGNQGSSGPVRFHPTRPRLMTPANGNVVEWDIASAAPTQSWPLTGVISALAYGPVDGQRLAHRQDGPVVQLEAGSPRVLIESDAVFGRFSDGGRWFVATRDEARLAIHDLRDPQAPPRLVAGRWPCAIDPTGTMLAAVDPDDLARLCFWSLATGQTVSEWIAPAPHAAALAFSGDGKVLASALADGRVLLWDIKRQRVVGSCLPVPDNPPHTMALNVDGSRLLSALPNLALYDTGSGQKLLDLLPPRRQVVDVAFGPAGRSLAASSPASGAYIWSVP